MYSCAHEWIKKAHFLNWTRDATAAVGQEYYFWKAVSSEPFDNRISQATQFRLLNLPATRTLEKKRALQMFGLIRAR